MSHFFQLFQFEESGKAAVTLHAKQLKTELVNEMLGE